jgi:hypothetical protein
MKVCPASSCPFAPLTLSFLSDLQTLLAEVAGDVDVAVTRITEGSFSHPVPNKNFTQIVTGHAEQWGSVTRKKDKKTPSHAPSKDSISISASGSRGEGGFRGGRGGDRGGRGGRGRGGAGGPRGRGGGGRGAGAAVNGHVPSSSVSATIPGNSWNGVVADAAPVNGADAVPDGDSWGSTAPDGGWGTGASPVPAVPAVATSAPGWGAPPTSAPPATSSTWTAETEVNGNGSAVPATPKPKLNTAKSKTPATSKMSWAQIARYVCLRDSLFRAYKFFA